MAYLIDTYNLMHAAGSMGGPLQDMTVRGLCRYLAASPAHVKATLILDGRAKPDEPSPNEFPDIALVYSGTGVKADTLIAQMVERSTHRKKITVVTNDRAVALHARRHYANAMSCEQFMRQLTEFARERPPAQESPAKLTGSPTSGESDHWLKEFGLDGDPNPQPPEPLRPQEDPLGDLNIEDLLGPRD